MQPPLLQGLLERLPRNSSHARNLHWWVCIIFLKENRDYIDFFIFLGMECMGCSVVAPEDFVLPLLAAPHMKERYVRHAFSDYVRSHPELRFCPGPNCSMIIRAKESKAKRIVCRSCQSTFWYKISCNILNAMILSLNLLFYYSFRCGSEYHAPTDCETIRQWLTKCADDSETANYISAHTKVNFKY